MKFIIKSIVGLLVTLGVLLIGFQLYNFYFSDIKTEVAYRYTVQDTIESKGVTVRNETIIDNTYDGVINYFYLDGDKVSKGNQIAEVYANEQGAAAKQRLIRLQSELKALQDTQTQAEASSLHVEGIHNQIINSIVKVSNQISQNDFHQLNDERGDLLTLLNKKQITMNAQTDFSARIAQLTQEISDAKQILASAKTTTVTAPLAGYFVGEVDGYESQLTPESMDQLTVAKIEEVMQQPDRESTHYVGKVLNDFEWYFAAIVSTKDADKFEEGVRITANFPFAGVYDVPMIVTDLKDSENKDQKIVVLSCNYVNKSLAKLRGQTAQLVFSSYTGLLVNQNAVRFENGVQGVYVKKGSQAVFKQLDVVYEGKGYVISRIHEVETEYLQAYEEIIVQGRDLYNGKVL